MHPSISLRCPGCNVRIRAPFQLMGQSRDCPNCGHEIVIRLKAPPESGPMLVADDRQPSVRSVSR